MQVFGTDESADSSLTVSIAKLQKLQLEFWLFPIILCCRFQAMLLRGNMTEFMVIFQD